MNHVQQVAHTAATYTCIYAHKQWVELAKLMFDLKAGYVQLANVTEDAEASWH